MQWTGRTQPCRRVDVALHLNTLYQSLLARFARRHLQSFSTDVSHSIQVKPAIPDRLTVAEVTRTDINDQPPLPLDHSDTLATFFQDVPPTCCLRNRDTVAADARASLPPTTINNNKNIGS